MREQNKVAQIERILSENKSGVKTYASYENAVAAAEKVANQHVAYTYGVGFPNPPRPCDFVPVFVPSTQRWAVIFLFQNWMQSNPVGGFVGFFAEKGFLQQ